MKRALCILAAFVLLPALLAASAAPAKGEEIMIGSVPFHDGWEVRDNARVFYEIFVGSFSDSDGDGIGDLRGIINRMDYLNDGDPASGKSLGVEGIWLTPVFLSPSYHKYDVTDYYTVDPAFGTEEDLKELIDLCHARDVKIILDLALNHTGAQHRWFRNSKNARLMHNPNNVFYDYYVWAEKGESLPAGRHFAPAGTSGALVEANFSDSMPELNYDNPAVRKAVLDVALYYLNLGVDGFRFDAAKYIYLGENEKNVAFWAWYTGELKKVKPDVYTVAEVWDGDGITDLFAPCVNCFRFTSSQAEGIYAKTAAAGDVNRMAKALEQYLTGLRKINPEAMHIPFLSNHDMDRAAGYLPMAGGRMAMAASLYILTPGSPFLYYGEEIGLRGSRGGANTDANRRLAMQWGDGDTVKDPAGSTYSKQTPYSVQDLLGMEGSLLNHYKKLLMVRRANPEIARGEVTALSFPDTKLGGFLCEWKNSTVAVLHNTTSHRLTVDLSQATDKAFGEISAVLECVPGQGGAELNGSVLTLGPQTSIVLR